MDRVIVILSVERRKLLKGNEIREFEGVRIGWRDLEFIVDVLGGYRLLNVLGERVSGVVGYIGLGKG